MLAFLSFRLVPTFYMSVSYPSNTAVSFETLIPLKLKKKKTKKILFTYVRLMSLSKYERVDLLPLIFI